MIYEINLVGRDEDQLPLYEVAAGDEVTPGLFYGDDDTFTSHPNFQKWELLTAERRDNDNNNQAGENERKLLLFRGREGR